MILSSIWYAPRDVFGYVSADFTVTCGAIQPLPNKIISQIRFNGFLYKLLYLLQMTKMEKCQKRHKITKLSPRQIKTVLPKTLYKRTIPYVTNNAPLLSLKDDVLTNHAGLLMIVSFPAVKSVWKCYRMYQLIHLSTTFNHLSRPISDGWTMKSRLTYSWWKVKKR